MVARSRSDAGSPRAARSLSSASRLPSTIPSALSSTIPSALPSALPRSSKNCRKRRAARVSGSVQEAAERVAANAPVAWAALALELGYHDQAHLIRDFRAQIGFTPATYARRCAAASLPREREAVRS